MNPASSANKSAGNPLGILWVIGGANRNLLHDCPGHESAKFTLIGSVNIFVGWNLRLSRFPYFNDWYWRFYCVICRSGPAL